MLAARLMGATRFAGRVDVGLVSFRSATASQRTSAADFDRDLAIDMPTQSDMRQLAARLLYACASPNAAAILKDRLPFIRRYLEKHDENLGVRAAWLVWLHLTKISGDVLGLARVRDRLIDRLFKNGLRRQFDVPNFHPLRGAAG